MTRKRSGSSGRRHQSPHNPHSERERTARESPVSREDGMLVLSGSRVAPAMSIRSERAVTATDIRDVVWLSARATEVFGSREKAVRWLETPVPSLGYRTPFSLLSTSEGMAEVEETLGAIEHGIW